MTPDLAAIAAYYDRALARHGATARGVDWNSESSQRLRFDQLARVWYDGLPDSLNDFGCGCGALLSHLRAQGVQSRYTGVDVTPGMLERARALHASDMRASFVARADELAVADFTVASGVFHVKLDATPDDWWPYVVDELDRMRAKSERGFAFNLLTVHSDEEKRKPHLFYADPQAVWDQCRRRYSRHVALLHDYPLYEFTIGVRLT